MNTLTAAMLKTSDSRHTISGIKCTIEEYNTNTDETREYEEYMDDSVKVDDVIYTYNSEASQKGNKEKRSVSNYNFNSSGINLEDLANIEFYEPDSSFNVSDDSFDISDEYKTVSRVLSIDKNDKISYVDEEEKQKELVKHIKQRLLIQS